MEVKYQNMTTPASFGVEWTAGDNGSRFQLANPRGTTGLLFGVLTEGKTEWSTTSVVEPSRFGLTDAPKTFAEFMKVVRAYVEA